jgi:DNA-binding transcriptional MocR family regulator
MLDALLQARVGIDLGCPVVDQLALAHLLDDDADLLSHHRARLAAQRTALATAVAELLPQWRFVLPAGGLALWCELPTPGATRLVHAAENRGVIVAPGSVFAVEGGLDRYVRIPWTQPAEVLRRAVEGLALAWDETQGHEPVRVAGSVRGRVLIA